MRARSTARASMASAIAYSAMTIAASGHWPITNAPVTATVISALMFSRPRRSAARPLRYTSKPDSPIATAATPRPAMRQGNASGANQPIASAAAASASATASRRRPSPPVP